MEKETHTVTNVFVGGDPRKAVTPSPLLLSALESYENGSRSELDVVDGLDLGSWASLSCHAACEATSFPKSMVDWFLKIAVMEGVIQLLMRQNNIEALRELFAVTILENSFSSGLHQYEDSDQGKIDMKKPITTTRGPVHIIGPEFQSGVDDGSYITPPGKLCGPGCDPETWKHFMEMAHRRNLIPHKKGHAVYFRDIPPDIKTCSALPAKVIMMENSIWGQQLHNDQVKAKKGKSTTKKGHSSATTGNVTDEATSPSSSNATKKSKHGPGRNKYQNSGSGTTGKHGNLSDTTPKPNTSRKVRAVSRKHNKPIPKADVKADVRLSKRHRGTKKRSKPKCNEDARDTDQECGVPCYTPDSHHVEENNQSPHSSCGQQILDTKIDSHRSHNKGMRRSLTYVISQNHDSSTSTDE